MLGFADAAVYQSVTYCVITTTLETFQYMARKIYGLSRHFYTAGTILRELQLINNLLAQEKPACRYEAHCSHEGFLGLRRVLCEDVLKHKMGQTDAGLTFAHCSFDCSSPII